MSEKFKPIRETIVLQTSQQAAFDRFANDFGGWWPAEYTWARDVLEEIAIEPHLGGRCYERGPYGFALDWGRVLVWEPPRRLVFTWQISPQRVPVPDPRQASQVEVWFEPLEGERTRVTLVHGGFENHGEGAAEYQEGLASPQGWAYILQCFSRQVESPAG